MDVSFVESSVIEHAGGFPCFFFDMPMYVCLSDDYLSDDTCICAMQAAVLHVKVAGIPSKKVNLEISGKPTHLSL